MLAAMGIAEGIRRDLESSSWIRRMFEAGAQLRQSRGAENVFDLSLGNPVMEPPEEFKAELRRLAADPTPGAHRYMPNAGYPETRAAVARALADETGLPYEPEHVVMTVGAAGAINCALRAMCDPGDEVLVLAPYFAEYLFYPRNHGSIPVLVGCGDAFMPALDDLAAKITPRTKALLLNSPNNPSGAIYPEAVVRAVAETLEREGARQGTEVVILSDEPYRHIVFDGASVPFPQAHYWNVITATSHSKDLALPGERIGFAAVSPRMPNAAQVADALIFANRVLGFVNAPALMQRAAAVLQGVAVDIGGYQRKRDLVYEGLTNAGYELVKPQGAFYAFPKSPVEDEMRLVDALMERGVLVVPGRGFGMPGYFRVSFCMEESVLEGAMPSFADAARELRG